MYEHNSHVYEYTVDIVITRYNIVRYYMNNYKNWGRKSIRCWIHKKTSHTSPYRASYVVSFVNICEKIDRVITAPHCMYYLNWRRTGESLQWYRAILFNVAVVVVNTHIWAWLIFQFTTPDIPLWLVTNLSLVYFSNCIKADNFQTMSFP